MKRNHNINTLLYNRLGKVRIAPAAPVAPVLIQRPEVPPAPTAGGWENAYYSPKSAIGTIGCVGRRK